MSFWKVARSPLVWVLIAALALRIAAGAWWQSRLPPGVQFAFGDSEGYWMLAGALARGAPYEYGSPPAQVFRTPGYPLILSTLFLAFHGEPPLWAALVLNAALGMLTVWGVYALALRLFERRAALLAAVIVAFYPGAIGTSVFVLSEAAFCPLLVAQLIASTIAWQSASTKATLAFALAAGCLAGAATLVRPSWLLYTPFATCLGLLTMRNMQRHLLVGACMLVGLSVVMSPWWLRNYQVTGHFIPTTLQVGASLYDGMNPTATGASDMAFVPEFVAQVEQEPADGETFEYRLDRRLREASLEWSETHPGRALQLAVVKFARLWNVWPNESEFRSWPMRLVVAATYVPLLLLAIAGAERFTPSGWPYAQCWLPAVYFTLIHMIFVSSLRYREPAMLPLAVLAAAVLVWSAMDAKWDDDDDPELREA
ncbi:MAG TPA: glycosyltransferase family 39 protein [Pirellulales bacterium]|jgi:4-amino-4-deoxy-L-arabinose transferase-like glycosyltransferase